MNVAGLGVVGDGAVDGRQRSRIFVDAGADVLGRVARDGAVGDRQRAAVFVEPAAGAGRAGDAMLPERVLSMIVSAPAFAKMPPPPWVARIARKRAAGDRSRATAVVDTTAAGVVAVPVAWLLERVLSVTVSRDGGSSPSPSRKIPPPDLAVLAEKVLLVTVSGLAPELKMPPPRLSGRIRRKGGTGERRHAAVVVVDAAAKGWPYCSRSSSR